VKIGFLGGSFDPIHFGHLLAAQDAYEQHKLDRLVIVPASQSPMKRATCSRPRPTGWRWAGGDRVEPASKSPTSSCAGVEVKHTIDSARHFRGGHPKDDLYWVIGGEPAARSTFGRTSRSWRNWSSHLPRETGLPVRATPVVARAPAAPLRWPSAGDKLDRAPGPDAAPSFARLFRSHKAIVYIREKGLYRDQR